MAHKKAAAKKPAARRRAPAKPRQTAQESKWEREGDVRTLQEAERIHSSRTRMSGAKREAAAQRKALDRIAKR